MDTARNELDLCHSKMSVCIKVMSYSVFIVLYADRAVHLEKMCERTFCKVLFFPSSVIFQPLLIGLLFLFFPL